jgi:lipoprotein-anchoring transpeptidase ErfK/SrfK
VHPITPQLTRRARLAAIVLVPLLALAACGGKESPEVAAPVTTPRSTTTTAATCAPAAEGTSHVAYARNKGQLAVYANPGDVAPSQTFDSPRKTDSAPPLEVPLAFLVNDEPADNCKWLNVHLPVRPNGSTGWVKRDDVTVKEQDFHIDVFLDEFNLKAYQGDEVILDVPIGVAAENSPTPGGLYYTTELLKSSDPTYGPWAFGLSGFSEKYTTYNSGQGQLGLHGTDQPEKIGTKVSHGCIRLKNEDIEKLVSAVQAASSEQGIPVQVYA